MKPITLILRSGFANVLILMAFTLPASAGSDFVVNKNEDNVAIEGYDTVAYFTESKPVPGTSKFEHMWQDTRWHFASAKNLKLFSADPERYAPRFGGFCVMGMALGVRYKVDPNVWTIVEDKLYLNYSEEYGKQFAADTETAIANAEANWPTVGSLE